MQNRTTRILGAAILTASLGAFLLTLPPMVRLLRAHNSAADVALFKIEPVMDPALQYHGDTMRIEESDGAAGRALTISWRGERIPIRLDGFVDDRLPGLVKYDKYVRVLSIAVAGREDETEEALALRPWRLFIAARHPPPGEDPETWGAVDRKKWRYEIIELLPEGASAPAPLPELSTTLTTPYGRPPSTMPESAFEANDAYARWSFNMAALPDFERTAQYAAAIEVTPPLHRPKNVFKGTGLEAMEWTWPAAGVSVMGMVVGGLLLASTAVRRPTEDPAMEAART